jgi:hypothetical protein
MAMSERHFALRARIDTSPRQETAMTISMYSASAPVFIRLLGNMLTWLDKAQAHAEARKFDPNNYLGLRLAPDMLPLVKQVQIASDAAKGCLARLAGHEVPTWDDTESSIDDLRARIRKTLAYVQSFEPVPRRNRDPLQFTGEAYLKHWALPNFFFHATTLYALLRHAGVELGKSDYLGG